MREILEHTNPVTPKSSKMFSNTLYIKVAPFWKDISGNVWLQSKN